MNTETPETDSTTCDFDNSAAWTIEDMQRALQKISELKREKNTAEMELAVMKVVEAGLRADISGMNARLVKQQKDMLDTIVERQLEITKWKSIAEKLVTAVDEIDYDAAVAAYESANKVKP